MTLAFVRMIIGIIGNITAIFMYSSPMPTFYRIYKNKSVEEFKPDPYIAGVMNCIFWVYYGIITPNSIPLITVDGIGLAFSLIYLAIFCYFSKQQRSKIVLWLLAEVVVTAAIACVASLAIHSQSKRSVLVGVCADLFGAIMYFSPLTIMAKVIKTKSVEFMPFWLSMATFSTGAVWAVYALIKVPPSKKIDWYILIGNGVGALFGASQLALYACYYQSTPKTTKNTEPEMQLSQA